MTMTPVQLPEVPAPNRRAFYVCTKCGYMGSFGPVHRQPDALTPGDCGYLAVTDGDTYTAAQLREYATEAVMAERRRLQEWPIAWADYWASQGDSALAHDFDIFAAANEWADANLRALIESPSETNSER